MFDFFIPQVFRQNHNKRSVLPAEQPILLRFRFTGATTQIMARKIPLQPSRGWSHVRIRDGSQLQKIIRISSADDVHRVNQLSACALASGCREYAERWGMGSIDYAETRWDVFAISSSPNLEEVFRVLNTPAIDSINQIMTRRIIKSKLEAEITRLQYR